jgi:hypothetical protein
MSLLNEASFLVTPNGYKEDKLYAAIPTNGDGDMTVTRATTATRVNEAGLVELVPYNLLLRSQEFDNASWSPVKATISANEKTAPDGTTTADVLTADGVSGQHYVLDSVTVVDTATYTCSIYAKAGTNNFIQFILGATPFASTTYCNFDLSNGSIGTAGLTALSPFAVSIGKGWYRIGFSAVAVSTGSANFFPVIVTSNTATFFESNTLTKSVYLWGAQVVEGSSALTYQKTVDRLDIPRIDYTDGGCPSILLEPQRTNLIPYSEDFSNAAWNKSGISVNSDSSTSPSGDINSDEIVENSVASTQHRVYDTVTISSGLKYSITCYVKRGVGSRDFSITSVTSGIRIYFDLTDGTVGTETNGTGEIESLGNGWFRCVGRGTSTGTSAPTYLQMTNGTTTGSETYNGDGVSSLYIWGAQVEEGAYPTSYIPTDGARVTRNADVISKTGISDLIGQTEGVLFVEMAALSNDGTFRQISLSDGSTDNRILLDYTTVSNQVRMFCASGGTSFVNSNFNITNSLSFNKIAFKYKINDFALWVNGVEVATDLSGSVPIGLNRLTFDNGEGTFPFFGKVKQLQVYKTALTDTQLAALTT